MSPAGCGPSGILVTGASGFIGRTLVTACRAQAQPVVATGRRQSDGFVAGQGVRWHSADLRSDPLDALLDGVGSVVHAAGVAHAAAPESLHRSVTVDGTRRLVEAMQRRSVRHIVFISSIRAQVGAASDSVVMDAAPLRPTDGYGRAKRDAEAVVAGSGLDYTILRPVLVADAGARGNLAWLLKLARSGIPLPFGALRARRSLVSRAALVDAVLFALRTPAAIGRVLNVADAEPLTIGDIVRALRSGTGPGRLLSVPPSVLQLALRLVGRADDFQRLARPLVVAADGLQQLGWSAPESARVALARMATATDARLA